LKPLGKTQCEKNQGKCSWFFSPRGTCTLVEVVIRDYEGKFMVASTIFLASTSTVEAMSMREGLALANLLNCNNVIMESDSLETIEAYSGGEAWWGESSAIFAYLC
jgi:hypothetical protein